MELVKSAELFAKKKHCGMTQKDGSDYSKHLEAVVNRLKSLGFIDKELQREGWQEYNKSKVSHEKLKALNLVRNLTLDKLKLHSHVPLSYKMGPKQQLHSFDESNDTTGDDSKDLKN